MTKIAVETKERTEVLLRKHEDGIEQTLTALYDHSYPDEVHLELVNEYDESSCEAVSITVTVDELVEFALSVKKKQPPKKKQRKQ